MHLVSLLRLLPLLGKGRLWMGEGKADDGICHSILLPTLIGVRITLQNKQRRVLSIKYYNKSVVGKMEDIVRRPAEI